MATLDWVAKTLMLLALVLGALWLAASLFGHFGFLQ
jgi:hypothetical protein